MVSVTLETSLHLVRYPILLEPEVMLLGCFFNRILSDLDPGRVSVSFSACQIWIRILHRVRYPDFTRPNLGRYFFRFFAADRFRNKILHRVGQPYFTLT